MHGNRRVMVVRLAQDGVKAIDLLTPSIRDRGSQRCCDSAQRQRQAMTSGINDRIHSPLGRIRWITGEFK
jgi:hypothetical protein